MKTRKISHPVTHYPCRNRELDVYIRRDSEHHIYNDIHLEPELPRDQTLAPTYMYTYMCHKPLSHIGLDAREPKQSWVHAHMYTHKVLKMAATWMGRDCVQAEGTMFMK